MEFSLQFGIDKKTTRFNKKYLLTGIVRERQSTMRDQILYQKHLNTIFGSKSLDDFSNEETEKSFEVLLQILPNEGKLYKYRSFAKDKFDNYYDALEKGYLWFPCVLDLNDDLDTVLYYDPVVEVENIRNYLLKNPRLYISAILRCSEEPIQIGFNRLDDDAFYKVIDCYDIETGKLDSSKAIKLLGKLGIPTRQAISFLKKVDDFVETFIANHQEIIESVALRFANANADMRKAYYVYSMSETYQSDPMWALYGNNNRGFCIEYDYYKAKSLSIEDKKKLLNTFGAIYSDTVKEFSFVKIIKYILADKKDKQLQTEALMELFEQLMTKRADWSFEKEWRIMLVNLEDNKIPIDIVSKIIIDERVLETQESKRLIELCKRKKWSVLIRKTQYINVAHKFEELL